MAYDNMTEFISRGVSSSMLDERKKNIKKQLLLLIAENESDEKNTQIEPLKDLFHDMLYNTVVYNNLLWDNLSPEMKAKKDYVRYVNEILSQTDRLYIHEITNDELRKKIRGMINNSFLDKNENFQMPDLFKDTFEGDSYKLFIDEHSEPGVNAGGKRKKTYKRSSTKKSKSRRNKMRK